MAALCECLAQGALLLLISFKLVSAYLTRRRFRAERAKLQALGQVTPGYEAVRETFKQNLHDGLERDGAALAVYHRGQLVVDLWGGFADFDSGRLWQENTMSLAFSSSKAIGAICVAMIVDRGHVRYDDKISSFWPNFAKKGKENITLKMVLEHSAGLPILGTKVMLEDAKNPDRIAELIENQEPIWEPGTEVGYHVLSYGWLVDQIIRRTDPAGRSVGQFFREEIAIPHNIEFFIGLPLELTYRVARIRRPTFWNRIEEWIADPESVDYKAIMRHFLTDGLLVRILRNVEWLQSVFKVTMNNPDLFALEQCAGLGIGTARSLVKILKLYSDGTLVSEKTLLETSLPTAIGKRDLVTNAVTDRGYGFTHVYYTRGEHSQILIGHSGFGGQNVRFDIGNDVCIAYLSNGLKGGLGDRAMPYCKLLSAIYGAVLKSQ